MYSLGCGTRGKWQAPRDASGREEANRDAGAICDMRQVGGGGGCDKAVGGGCDARGAAAQDLGCRFEGMLPEKCTCNST